MSICIYIYFIFLDNVHFQQAAQISKALVEQQVDFEAMVSVKRKCDQSDFQITWNELYSDLPILWPYSGIQTRTMVCLARPATTSTHTSATFFRSAFRKINNHLNCRKFVLKQNRVTHIYIDYDEMLRNWDLEYGFVCWMLILLFSFILFYFLLCWSSKTWLLHVFIVCMFFIRYIKY